MAFIIIDLEFNNLSGIHKCIPNVYNDNPGLKNLELDNEIIEIGAVKLDAHMQPCEELKVYIKPSVIPIINPKILGSSLSISPLLVIFAVTIGGAYFGVLGMFLAVPVATVIKLLIEEYINYKYSTR